MAIKGRPPYETQVYSESEQRARGLVIGKDLRVEKRPGCRFIPLADERASRTIGAITLRGKSSTRLQEAFLAHLRGQVTADLARSAPAD